MSAPQNAARSLSLLALLILSAPALALDDGPPPAPAPDAPPGEEAAPFEPHVAATTGDEVRVRAGPSINFRVLERLPRGSWMVVTGPEEDGFVLVRIPGGIPVFVAASLCEVKEDGKSAVVRKSDVLMRPTPGQEYFPLEGQKLQEGDALTVLETVEGEGGAWLRVLPPDRVAYFVHGSLLAKVAAEGEKAEELARVTLERRDGYTGGREAEAAREAMRQLESAFEKIVDAAAAALEKAPAETLPADAEARREQLRQVMTESGSPLTRGRAAAVSRDYLQREREMLIATAKAEKSAVAADLEKKLAEVEARYRAAMADLLKAAPRKAPPRHIAVGTLRRGRSGGFDLVKAGVILHHCSSLRYDLSEFLGLRVGVNGKRIAVDPEEGVEILRIDALEILE